MEIDPSFRHDTEENNTGNWLLKAAGAVIGILIISLCIWKILPSFHASTGIDPAVVNRIDDQAKSLAERLDADPCNRSVATQLATDLLQYDEYASVIKLAQATAAKCGGGNDMLPAVFAAEAGLSQFADAERTANKIIAEYPADPDAYGWRAQAREGRGDIEGAYADMKTALLLFPDPSNVAAEVYYDTAKLAEKLGKPCEAGAFLRDYLAYDIETRRNQQIDTLIKQWQKEGSCPPVFGTGSASIRFKKHDAAIIVPVKINGVEGRMILDTGATRTLVSSEFADKTTISLSGKNDTVETANGVVLVGVGRAKTVSLGEATVRDSQIYIAGDSLGDGVDGLIGLSFLGNFQVQIGDGILSLKPLTK